MRIENSGFDGVDADFALIATFALKCNLARNFCKESIIFAASDIQAGVKMRAALTDENTARRDDCTGLLFDAKTLRFAVTTVTSGADAFFMCKTL